MTALRALAFLAPLALVAVVGFVLGGALGSLLGGMR